ncbi:hypothetical protein [Methylomonas koyamae]|nr:hypothetical protein [Methylomonas koyamae]
MNSENQNAGGQQISSGFEVHTDALNVDKNYHRLTSTIAILDNFNGFLNRAIQLPAVRVICIILEQ